MFEEPTLASVPCTDGYSSTLQTISLTIPQGALAIKAKHQFFFFLNSFLHYRRQFSVDGLMINGILVNVSVNLLAAEL